MGYVFCIGGCIGCGRSFTFNPAKVPSVLVKGQREPVCMDCVRAANPERARRGLDQIQVLPGAYDSCEESEI